MVEVSALVREEEATAALAGRLRAGDRAAMQAAFAEHGPAIARTPTALIVPLVVTALLLGPSTRASCRSAAMNPTTPARPRMAATVALQVSVLAPAAGTYEVTALLLDAEGNLSEPITARFDVP